VSSSGKFSTNENGSSPLKRVAIGIGTLVVIALMVFAAIFLAIEDLADEQPATSVAVSTPTVIATTPATVQSAASPTTIPPTNTQTPTTIPSNTPIPTLTFTPTSEPLPPTDTPIPAPTATATPQSKSPTAAPTQAPPPTPPGGGPCEPPADWVQYEAQTGDTLNSLAERTGTTPFVLYETNCLESYTIRPGQVIYLPFIPPTPTASSTSTPVTPSPTPTRTGTPSPTPRAPEIFSSEPTTGNISDEVVLAVQGRYFLPNEDGFRVELRSSGIKFDLVLGEIRTQSSFEAIIPANTLGPDTYDLWVINPDDQFDIRRSAYTAEAE